MQFRLFDLGRFRIGEKIQPVPSFHVQLGWIRRQQKQFAKQPRQSRRQMVSGETHYYLGRAYRLRVEETGRPSRAVLRNRTTLVNNARNTSLCTSVRI